jgi:hypothetical protein
LEWDNSGSRVEWKRWVSGEYRGRQAGRQAGRHGVSVSRYMYGVVVLYTDNDAAEAEGGGIV